MKIERCNGRIQPRRNEQVIQAIKNTVAVLWRKACEFDEIAPDAKFVVFSDSNKFAKFYSLALAELGKTIAEANAGGYVGLTMDRKAVK